MELQHPILCFIESFKSNKKNNLMPIEDKAHLHISQFSTRGVTIIASRDAGSEV
jgi:hypothetical protein